MVLVGLVADIVKDSIRRPFMVPSNGRNRPGADAAEAVAARGRNRRRGHQDVPRDRKRNVLDRYTAGCRRCFACAPKPASRNSPMRRHAAEWATPRSISRTPAHVSAQRRQHRHRNSETVARLLIQHGRVRQSDQEQRRPTPTQHVVSRPVQSRLPSGTVQTMGDQMQAGLRGKVAKGRP